MTAKAALRYSVANGSPCLVDLLWRRHAIGMFIVTEADAAAIRAVYDREGELSAAIELRRRFPGITDNATARLSARTIAGWQPLPTSPERANRVVRLRPGKRLRTKSAD